MRRAMLVVALGTIACSSDHMGTGPIATRLVFSGQPSAATAGVVITPAIQVTALDDGGAVVTSFNGTITIALAANPGGATLSGTLIRGAIGGVATFADVRLNRTGSGYTFLASSGSLSTATSSSFVIAPAPPVQLAFTVQPTDVVAGVAMTPAVLVLARDSLGNVAPSFTGSVALGLAPNGAGAVLGGTTSVSAVAGVATFAALHVDKSGSSYAIQAAAAALTGTTSSSFNVAAAAAKRLVFIVEPTGPNPPVAGLPLTVQVAARDTFDNNATGFGGSVAIAIGANPAGGTLSGTTPVTAVNGTATFSDLSLSKSGVGYTLVTSAAGLVGDTTAPFTVNPGNVSAASTVVAAPTTITASNGSSSATITVTALDALGDPVPGAVVTLSATGTGYTLTQPSGPTNANGVATGSISATATGAKVVSATVAGVLATQTATVTVTPAAAASLGFTVQPTATSAASPITPAVQVTASDAFGNRATGFAGSVTIAIGANPGGGTLTGTLTAVADTGVATFANLKIDKAAAGYTLMASSGALTQGTSLGFAITVGPAAKLAFAVQPSNAAAGAAITPAVQVAVQDAGGNLVATATNNITITLGANPGGGTLAGTLTASASGGVAQFSSLNIDKTGTGYTLQATAAGLTTAVSTPFTITSGTADHLAFIVQPATAVAGVSIAPAIQVAVEDAIGNRVTSATTSVTLAILDNPNGGVLSGTATVAAVSGVATFSNLSINKSGTGYSLSAAATALTGDVSADFDITPASAARVSFFAEPTSATAGAVIAPSVQVEILDAFGNRVPTAVNNVTMSFASNPGSGTLSGTLSHAAVAGVATFSDLSINKVGTGYKLRASGSGLAVTDTSLAFNITAG
ncbi:MAG TPA: invasin domain 3-containing protein, partial [Gemmatimonadales bacterium]|nr:invasin domain 3-containing protein [Gemmatimonadales bacterium]